MTERLSKEDVVRLLSNPSSAVRADLAAKVAGQFTEETLSANERKLAEEIIRIMAHDTVEQVRQLLAENLKTSTSLPHDVALTLARDVEAVAIPILSVSQVLTDTDLVEIIRSGQAGKHTAIAGRPTVSSQVAEAIIENASETAVAALVSNEGAELGEQNLDRIIDRFGDSEAVQAPLVQRSKLPITIAERLVAVVSETLQNYLVTHHELSAKTAADLILESRERATVTLLNGQNDEVALERLVVQLSRAGRLTPSILVRALCMGDITFFEAALAHLAGIRLTNARLLIHDAGGLGFKSIYDKAKMPAALLPACRIALDVLGETLYDGEEHDLERRRRRLIERILTQYEGLAPDDLDYLIKKFGDLAPLG